MDINTGQDNTAQTTITAAELVKIVNYLILIGAVLSVIATEDKIIQAAAYTKVLAGFIAIGATLVESKEQQISPGVTTPLNRLKTLGATVTIIGALILTYVLNQETALRQAGIMPPTAPVQPIIAPAFL